MIKIGVTGGIGSGKSIFCKIFSYSGYPVYDSDKKAKEILNQNNELKEKVILLLGSHAYDRNGQYNRNWVANVVFNDLEKLKKLNGLIHPYVANDFEEWLKINKSCSIIVKETALLIETGLYKKMDFNINVTAPLSLRIERILKRDPMRNEHDIWQIINKQLTDNERNKYVDYVVVNDEKKSLIEQFNHVFQMLNE
jgi:dephospho-CoA kinase